MNDELNRRGSWGGLDGSILAAEGNSERLCSGQSDGSSEKSLLDDVPTSGCCSKGVDRRCSWGDLDSMMEDMLRAAASAAPDLDAIDEGAEEKEERPSIKKKSSSRRLGSSVSSGDKKKKSRQAELRKKISRVRSMDRETC